MMTQAALMPKGVPGCVVPSIVRLEVRSGNADARVMVRPARDWSAMLNTIKSGVAVPLAAAWVMASRREPGPLSAFVVTVNVVAKPEKAQASRRRVRVSFIDSVQNREKWRQRQGGVTGLCQEGIRI